MVSFVTDSVNHWTGTKSAIASFTVFVQSLKKWHKVQSSYIISSSTTERKKNDFAVIGQNGS